MVPSSPHDASTLARNQRIITIWTPGKSVNAAMMEINHVRMEASVASEIVVYCYFLIWERDTPAQEARAIVIGI